MTPPQENDGSAAPDPPTAGLGDGAEVHFAEVVGPLHQQLYSLALAITANRAVAEDAVGAVYAGAWSRFRKGDIVELDRYLWRSVARQARRSVLLHRRAPLPVGPSRPEDPADIVARESGLAELLSKLPSNQRTVIALRFSGGFTESEIAELLGLPLGTVKSRLARAAATLRARYPGVVGARRDRAPTQGIQP